MLCNPAHRPIFYRPGSFSEEQIHVLPTFLDDRDPLRCTPCHPDLIAAVSSSLAG
jgi:hypothetical protein